MGKRSPGQGWGGSVSFFPVCWSNNANREGWLEGKIHGPGSWQGRKKRHHFPPKEEKAVLPKNGRGRGWGGKYLLLLSHPIKQLMQHRTVCFLDVLRADRELHTSTPQPGSV